MKPALPQVTCLCPEAKQELVREHLRRLDEEYFDQFALRQVVEHLRSLERLSRKNPVEIIVKPQSHGVVESTIMAFDYPHVFSLICGVLCASGASIISGDVFTYEKASNKAPAPTAERRRPAATPSHHRPLFTHDRYRDDR